MHAGNNLLTIGGMTPSSSKTTSRIPTQLMQWVQEEYMYLAERSVK